MVFWYFFFNDTATTEIYTLSLHDALPIYKADQEVGAERERAGLRVRHVAELADHLEHALPRLVVEQGRAVDHADRKSTRLNSSHANISYAVFCLKKKKLHNQMRITRRASL